MRDTERAANLRGYPYREMMLTAGTVCADIICDEYDVSEKKVAVVCGKGNNGGDGFVAAARLAERGAEVLCLLACGEPSKPDAKYFFDALSGTGCTVTDISGNADVAYDMLKTCDYIIDAVFGCGFAGSPGDELNRLFAFINTLKSTKISVDLPSGAECDSGEIKGECIRCDLTVAISSPKPAHVFLPSRDFCGKTVYADIGFLQQDEIEAAGAPMLICSVDAIPRRTDSNKGDFGRVLCICGSKSYIGAAVLSASGAVRSGAGLVYAAFPESAYPAIAPKLTEPVLLPMPSDENGCFSALAIPEIIEAMRGCSAVLLGCGLGKSAGTRRLVEAVLFACRVPLVLDADGINIAAENINILKAARSKLIITPHPGEMSRLTGMSISKIQADRVKAAEEFAAEHGCVLVLKGSGTVVSDGSKTVINTAGNPGMAKGGSGDLLAGIIAGLLAQGQSSLDAAANGVFLHALAGDAAAEKMSMQGMTPTDMLNQLPYCFHN